MRRAIIGLALVLTAAQAAAEPTPHPACLEEPVSREVRGERVLRTWPDGATKVEQIDFVDDSYVQIELYPNGHPKRETNHAKVLIDGDARRRRNVKHGTEKRWHENGQLFVCAIYEHGKKTGTWIYYGEDGTPASAFTYENDKEVEHLTHSKVFGWQPFGR